MKLQYYKRIGLMSRIFVDLMNTGIDLINQNHEGYWSGAGQVFKRFKGFGLKVIRSEPTEIIGLLAAQLVICLSSVDMY